MEFDRGEQKFSSLEELKERIEKDKEFALEYFSTVQPCEDLESRVR